MDITGHTIPGFAPGESPGNTSDCRSRGPEFHLGPDLYFCGDWSWVVVSYKRKYVHKVLVNRLVNLAHEKVWLGELTVSTWLQLLNEIMEM